MHARLAETMGFVEEKRRELLESIRGVPVDVLRRRPMPDTWSVAEILDHLHRVESGVARLITKRVSQARAAGIGEETSTTSVISSLDRYDDEFESSRLRAPETVWPSENADVSEALESLARSREALRTAAALASGVPLGEIKHTHPLLGELDLYQWLIFIGKHEVRHRRQIERTLHSISV